MSNPKQPKKRFGALEIVALVVVVVAIACGATVKIMTGTFAVCANNDLGQLVNGVPLESVVASIIEADLPALEADLTALVTQVGIDAVDCAIAAIEAAFPLTTTTAGSAIAINATRSNVTISTAAVHDALIRAHAFVKQWRMSVGAIKPGN